MSGHPYLDTSDTMVGFSGKGFPKQWYDVPTIPHGNRYYIVTPSEVVGYGYSVTSSKSGFLDSVSFRSK